MLCTSCTKAVGCAIRTTKALSLGGPDYTNLMLRPPPPVPVDRASLKEGHVFYACTEVDVVIRHASVAEASALGRCDAGEVECEWSADSHCIVGRYKSGAYARTCDV